MRREGYEKLLTRTSSSHQGHLDWYAGKGQTQTCHPYPSPDLPHRTISPIHLLYCPSALASTLTWTPRLLYLSQEGKEVWRMVKAMEIEVVCRSHDYGGRGKRQSSSLKFELDNGRKRDMSQDETITISLLTIVLFAS
jgi:hypothetical protein